MNIKSSGTTTKYPDLNECLKEVRERFASGEIQKYEERKSYHYVEIVIDGETLKRFSWEGRLQESLTLAGEL